MRPLRTWLAGCVGVAFWASSAFAATMTDAEYQAKLKTYDAAAVQAATSYAKTFDMMGFFARTAPQMVAGLQKQLRDKNPGITDDQVNAFVESFKQAALVDNADVVNHAVVLGLLDTFSGEELVSLDKFYSTPVGQSILKKFPTLAQKLGEARRLMSSDIVPKALEAAKAKLKVAGVEVKM